MAIKFARLAVAAVCCLMFSTTWAAPPQGGPRGGGQGGQVGGGIGGGVGGPQGQRPPQAQTVQQGQLPVPGARGGEGMPQHPLLIVFDADHNGVITGAEFEAVIALMKQLDVNEDGMLTANELPGMEGRGHGPRGQVGRPVGGPGPIGGEGAVGGQRPVGGPRGQQPQGR